MPPSHKKSFHPGQFHDPVFQPQTKAGQGIINAYVDPNIPIKARSAYPGMIALGTLGTLRKQTNKRKISECAASVLLSVIHEDRRAQMTDDQFDASYFFQGIVNSKGIPTDEKDVAMFTIAFSGLHTIINNSGDSLAAGDELLLLPSDHDKDEEPRVPKIKKKDFTVDADKKRRSFARVIHGSRSGQPVDILLMQ